MNKTMFFGIAVLLAIVVTVVLINPVALAIGGAALAVVPIFGTVKGGDFKELSADEIAKLEPDQQIKYFSELKEFRKAEMKTLKDQMKKEYTDEMDVALAKARNDMMDANNKMYEAILDTQEKQGNALNQLLSKGIPAEKVTVAAELKANKDKIIKLAKGVGADEVELKALTTRAAITNNEQSLMLPTIGQLATAARNIYGTLRKVPLSGTNNNGKVVYYDWDADTIVRAAAAVAEGAAFPESTAKFAKYEVELKKIGDTLPVTEEFFEDEQMFANELQRFLITNVEIIENSTVGTDLLAACTAYTAAAAGIASPSIYDLVVKAREAVEKGANNKYKVDVAYMNLTDINRYKLEKDANNNYVMPPFYDAGGNRIDGVTVVEDNSITANTMILGDRRFAEIHEKTGYQVSKGYTGTQFAEDEMTLKVRKRLLLLVREADKGGWLKVTDIDDALTTLGQ